MAFLNYDSAGNPYAAGIGGTRYYFIRNLQGDVTGLIDADGNQVVEYRYDSWGNTISITGSLADTVGQKNPFRYRGYYYDAETGLYYLGSRYYDPAVKRFISADTRVSEIGGDIRGYNMFSYCFDNPMNMLDSDGAWPKLLEMVTKVVAVAAAAVTTAMVLTSTGGIWATIGLGVALSGINGGYFNEKNGGSFTAGYVGGAVSGAIQGVATVLFGKIEYDFLGTWIGGSVGSGVGTLITACLENKFGSPHMKKTPEQIAMAAGKSAFVALFTSGLSVYVNEATKSAMKKETSHAYGLMPTIDKPFVDTLNAALCAWDDAMTYIVLMTLGW